MNLVTKKNIVFATVAVIVTIIFMSVYVIGQQIIRLSANMPQIEMAEDIAQKLNNGARLVDVLPEGEKVNPAVSSAAFVVIFDKKKNVVAYSGEIDGKIPTVPEGVLKQTPKKGYNAVTWQPKENVRLASVEVRANDYYVLTARSLAEPEKLVDTIGKLTLVGYVAAMVMLVAGHVLYINLPKERK